MSGCYLFTDASLRLIYVQFCIALVMLVTATKALAHPVSYKGAIGIMPNYSRDRQDLEVNYSFSSKAAVGFSAMRMDDESEISRFFIPRLNYRVYRDNERGSQTNFYISSGLGLKRHAGHTDGVGMISTQFDSETRRLYGLLGTEHLLGFDGETMNRFEARVGIAPYLGEFDDLHTWLIGRIELTPELERLSEKPASNLDNLRINSKNWKFLHLGRGFSEQVENSFEGQRFCP